MRCRGDALDACDRGGGLGGVRAERAGGYQALTVGASEGRQSVGALEVRRSAQIGGLCRASERR